MTTTEKSRRRVHLLLILFSLVGCIEQTPARSGDVLIRIGDAVATADDFDKALDNAKSAHSRGALQDTAVYEQIRLAVLNQIIEEMIVREVAKTHGIQVTDAELDSVVQLLKQDYPEGEFDRVLLERAVSFDSWKQRLKSRLLAEKVAETVLGDQIAVSQEEIAAYYAMADAGNGTDASESREDEAVLKFLRKEKIEKAYTIWMNNLKKEMPIEVNRDQWASVFDIEAEGEKKRSISADSEGG